MVYVTVSSAFSPRISAKPLYSVCLRPLQKIVCIRFKPFIINFMNSDYWECSQSSSLLNTSNEIHAMAEEGKDLASL